MKFTYLLFMLVFLGTSTGVVFGLFSTDVFLLVGAIPVLLLYIFATWRVIRIRIGQGKSLLLPGYWQLRYELWTPMLSTDRKYVLAFSAFTAVEAVVAIIFSRVPFEIAFAMLPSSFILAISYVLACYGEVRDNSHTERLRDSMEEHNQP